MIIIIPYRNREEHLAKFKEHYSNWDILVVEQDDDKPFNRGKLLNVGFDYVRKMFDTFIFHDVDMLSEKPIKYERSILEHVSHFATRCSQFNYTIPYDNYVGGILAMSKDAFIKCNGFPNECWGWGAEDDIMYERIRKRGYRVWHYPNKVESLAHEQDINNELRKKNTDLLRKEQASESILNDGLSTLKYKLSDVKQDGKVTHIKVSI